jgi:hypothetical protein
VNRLAGERGDGEQERESQRKPPETRGDGTDSGKPDQPWPERERSASGKKRGER